MSAAIERVGVVGGGIIGTGIAEDPDAILASNTSSTPIVDLGAAAGSRGGNVVGLLLQRLISAGMLGRKSGRGLFTYE
jgi:3-hydroxyacyl-CoA dehydrogenase